MELEIRLYNEFKKYSPEIDYVFSMSFAAGDTVEDVLRALKFPADMPSVVLLNGRRVDADTRINSESKLVVFSPVSGG